MVLTSPPCQTLSFTIDPITFGEEFSNHRRLLHFLSQCTSMSQLKQIHAQTVRTTSPHHPQTLFLHSRILHFSCLHDLDYAFRLFSQIEHPNSFIWNTLIRGCSHIHNRKEEAIGLYLRMLREGVVLPDKHTFPFVLKACAYLFALREGEQVQGHAVKLGFDSDVYVNNSLIHFYGSCGSLGGARNVFDKMPERSVVSWNAMIDVLVLSNEFEAALDLVREMQLFYKPDGYAIQSVLRACAGLGALSLGMWVHAYVLKKRSLELASNVQLSNSLLEMYCKCGSLETATQVFDSMSNKPMCGEEPRSIKSS